MSVETIVADFVWGPIALLINLVEHGFILGSATGMGELIASVFGTMGWASVGAAIVGFIQ